MTSEIRANTLKNRVGLGTVSFTNTGPVVSGIVTANSIDLNGDLDVDGHTNLDNVSIVGIATVTGSSQINFGGGTTQLQISNSNDSDINHNESNGSGLRFRINGQTQMVVKTDSITYGANLHNYYTNRVAVHSGDIDTFIGFPANDTFSIETGGNEVFNITYNRIGLNGTIPTASHANVTSSIHLADSNTILSRTGNQYFALFQNLKYTSADAIRYLVNGYASAYAQNAGTHRFYTVGNGTGNTNATVTERLHIKNDGKIGISRTPTQHPLEIQHASEPTVSLWRGSTKSAALQAQSGGTYLYSYENAPLLFSVNSGQGFTERLRIDTNGNLKQGTSNPGPFTSTSPTSGLRFLGNKVMQGCVSSTTTLNGSGAGTFDFGKLWTTDDTSIELFIQVVRNDSGNYTTHYAKAFINKVRGSGMSQGHILYQNGAAQSNGFSITGISAGGYTGSGGSSHGTQITVTGGAGGVIYRATCFYTAISKNAQWS